MKSFRVKFIGTLLILAVFVLAASGFGVFKFANLTREMYPMFENMYYPMLVLCELMVLSLIIAIVIGIFALFDYGKGEIFVNKMLLKLQLISLAFIGIFILSILAIIYTSFNLDGSITNILFFGVCIIAMLFAQVFLLLSDLIKEGIVLKEENELTI
ncbi:DUF2975 domain-containing protein [Peptoniphilus sp. MSJ-1]|uniref:DUF2975 domain-containing protein n=1 Tax=Peptoniphilus ovalis TaxID=2841503 RepID=A0ABS6FHY9_9FIRM|nr:DUF2975 domain-containing protein [Peptoniphilus ovalis]MBU5669790.1 DUF2975 domain-containing protein [Peptoniphilus ovalis]